MVTLPEAVVLSPASPLSGRKPVSPRGIQSHGRIRWPLIVALFTLAMLLIHGYHPFAEDGGLYFAGIEYQLDPSLFPHGTAFVTSHLRYSLFAPTIAAIMNYVHLPLAWVCLGAYVVSLWLTLYGALAVLRRCFRNPQAQLAGVALLAAWASLPIAGTSLLLDDPYLTARSLSTPLSLFAIAFALDDWGTMRKPKFRSLSLCALALLSAGLFHPLMTAYAFGLVIALRISRATQGRLLYYAAMGTLAIAAAGMCTAFAPTESPAVVAASLSRYYWFLSQWHWYELCGLAAPMILFAAILRVDQSRVSPQTRLLCRACLAAGAIAMLIAVCFAHRDAPTHLVARLQPLRIFLLLYIVMILLVAATVTQFILRLGEAFDHGAGNTPAMAFPLALGFWLVNAAIFFAVQRATFPASPHLELPFVQTTNRWSQAFQWVRINTPQAALFAIDAQYISTPGEDAQTFRSTALRSVLPDYSKDGGEASITPSLAVLWQRGVIAQTALSHLSDAARDARLLPLGVTWVVLSHSVPTSHSCPYDNGSIKVCHLVP